MKKLQKITGSFALFLLAALIATFANPLVLSSYAESGTTDVTLNINAVMSLSLDANSIALDTTPGHFVSDVINATVSTNSQYGYTLTLEDVDSNTHLVHTNEGVSDSFSSEFSGSKTSSEMDNNTWGFSLNADDYFKVPQNGSPVALKRTLDKMTTASEVVPVTFGIKVGNVVSGSYSDQVLFTMYVNGQDGKPSDGTDPEDPGEKDCYGIHCIASMQEMTTEICAESTTPDASATDLDWTGEHHGDPSYVPRTILTDYRDFNVYTVSKLADGNCWMSQNLALVLDKTMPLTNYRTDLNTKESWTPANSTMTSSISGWPRNNTRASQDPYSYRLVRADRYYRDGTTKASSPTRNSKEYYWEDGGAYYNWYAATAGTGIWAATFSDDSICPKGWMLPPRAGDKSFDNLVTLYQATPTSVLQAPLNFVHAGSYTFSNASTSDQGSKGYYYTSNGNGEHVYVFKVDHEVATVQIMKGNGNEIRCVAR